MPLVKKEIPNSNIRFLAYMCCLPCEITACFAGLFCMLCCGRDGYCPSCCDDSTEHVNARSIARSALTYKVETIEPKLIALETSKWHPGEHVTLMARFEENYALESVHSKICEITENLLNNYNL